MKGRLFVVNEETYESTIRTNIASVFVPDAFGTQWVKTIADLMADMLQIEIGDYIFLWETGSATRKNRIHGVFRAISAPFFEQTNPDEKDLFKVRIERAYTFEEALDEYDLLNCPFIKEPLWTIIGKKVAGKSRGTSPLSMDEVKFLINLLVGKNPNYRFIPFDSARIIEVANPLRINIVSRGDNPDINNSRDLFERTMTPADIHFFNEDGSPKYEKVLETIFNQEMADRNADFFSQIGIDVNKVIWYCNYLPYSIEQSEMDYLIIESDDGFVANRLFLIEFIKARIDNPHIYRSMLYSKWINETLAIGVPIAQPIIICPTSFDFINEGTARATEMHRMNNYIEGIEREFNTKRLQVYTYDFTTAAASFTRKR